MPIESVQSVQQGQILWEPSEALKKSTRLHDYLQWLGREHGVHFDDYASAWKWSVADVDRFWTSIWKFFEVIGEGDLSVARSQVEMPGVEWFPNTRLNYAENVFRYAHLETPALITRSENRGTQEVSWKDLSGKVASLAAYLRSIDVKPGDRVVSLMPNIAETTIAFLACASIGAIWSSCSPEMGISVVVDRFKQIEPSVLFAVDSYGYNGKQFDKREAVTELLAALPTIEHVVHVPNGKSDEPAQIVAWPNATSFSDATSQLANPADHEFARLPFNHPLWVVYSSGTTGLPKAMVHSHGGIVLTHLKTQQLQHDLQEGDRTLFLGGTGWIVWNLMVGGLLTGATIVLYDGNPAWPTPRALWNFLEDKNVTHLGCGAAYLMATKKSGVNPREFAKLEHLRAMTSTGSPLPVDVFEWVYESVKPGVWLASISGGTDIASGFVSSTPYVPVRAGEIQFAELGVDAHAFNDQGQAVVDEVGELVITQPMPSMPIYFWGDEKFSRYRESYFEMFPGIWRQGDWIRFTEHGGSVIYGRSDTTINRFGIRMGTAEIYRVVEELPEIKDSLVVDLEYLGKDSYMPLFVVLQDGFELTDELKTTVKNQIRQKASARHVPDEIFQIASVPRTLTGKKMELPVRKLLLGSDAASVANPATMVNPESFDYFVDFAKSRHR